MKKQVITGIVAMSAMFMLGTNAIHAEGTHDTTVTYNNNAELDDGTADPEFAVTVPVSVEMDNSNKETSFSVEAISKSADEDISTILSGKNLTVNVTSANNFKLQLESNADPVAYTLSKKQFTLTGAAPSDSATIKITGTARTNGAHKDTLTFTLAIN